MALFLSSQQVLNEDNNQESVENLKEIYGKVADNFKVYKLWTFDFVKIMVYKIC